MTPYQVNCSSRPWIGDEEKMFYETLMQMKANVVRRLHFENEKPSLGRHFEILNEFSWIQNDAVKNWMQFYRENARISFVRVVKIAYLIFWKEDTNPCLGGVVIEGAETRFLRNFDYYKFLDTKSLNKIKRISLFSESFIIFFFKEILFQPIIKIFWKRAQLGSRNF